MPDILGGAALPVRRVTSGPFVGGPVKAVYGYFAAPGDRPAGGGPAIPVRVLTSLEIAAGGYIVEGGAAIPVYDAPAGTPEMGGAALPVYAINGVAAWPFSYLLHDEFSDDRAAGAVNGTPAVPGPGTRVVTDTTNKLSIAGGVGNVSSTNGIGDPGLWYGQFSRLGGRLVKAKITLTNTDGSPEIGWDVNQVTGLSESVRFGAAGTLRVFSNGANIYSVTYSAGVLYECCVIERATAGAWHLVKGGAFSNWTLLYVNDSTPALLYPGISTTINPGSVFTFDSFRVPQQLYIPTPLAYAAFGGADGPLGNTDVLGPDLQMSPVLPWTDQVGTWAIVSNKAAASALVGGEALATVLTTSPDIHIRAKLTRAGGNVGITARLQNSSNYLRAYHDGTNVVCQQVVAGVPTTLRTGAAAFVANAYIYLIVSGTTGWLFYNNVAIGASFTVPASAQKNHGSYTTNTGNTLDNFEAWPYGTGGEHAFLGLI